MFYDGYLDKIVEEPHVPNRNPPVKLPTQETTPNDLDDDSEFLADSEEGYENNTRHIDKTARCLTFPILGHIQHRNRDSEREENGYFDPP